MQQTIPASAGVVSQDGEVSSVSSTSQGMPDQSHRGQDRFLVQRRQRAWVHHLDLDTLPGERFGGFQRLRQHPADGDDRDVPALSAYGGLPSPAPVPARSPGLPVPPDRRRQRCTFRAYQLPRTSNAGCSAYDLARAWHRSSPLRANWKPQTHPSLNGIPAPCIGRFDNQSDSRMIACASGCTVLAGLMQLVARCCCVVASNRTCRLSKSSFVRHWWFPEHCILAGITLAPLAFAPTHFLPVRSAVCGVL
jgi:hypothetical protein